jgi:hypothetical protein
MSPRCRANSGGCFAGCCVWNFHHWLIQKIMRIRTDGESMGAWAIRIVFMAGMMLSALIEVIRFVATVGMGTVEGLQYHFSKVVQPWYT